MSGAAESIGAVELERMQREGWRFESSGVRVANGWMVMAVSPEGAYVPQILADPEDEPEKWPDASAEPAEIKQGELDL